MKHMNDTEIHSEKRTEKKKDSGKNTFSFFGKAPESEEDEKYKKEKPRDRRYVLLRLWSYLYQYKWLLFLALFLTIVSNLLGLVGPMLSGYAIDAIHGPNDVDFPLVFFYAALMIGFYALSSLLTYILTRITIRFSQRVIYQMRKDVFDTLMELPVGYFDRTQTGDIISRISYDIDTVNASLSNDLLQICTSMITVIGSLVMMLMIAPALVSVFVITIPASILLTRYMTRKVRPLFRKRSAKLGELNGYTEEIISGQKTIKAYHQEETMISRFDQKNTEAVDAYYNADYYGSMTGPSVNFINNLSLSLISVLGAVLYLFQSISLGDLSSFVLYSRKFSGPINEAANILSELQSATAAAERVFRLIDEAPEPADAPDAVELTDVKGDVRMEHICFGYLPGQTILHDLSFHAEPGSLTAIVGPTGAGKTTLINLLMRFYDPQSGDQKKPSPRLHNGAPGYLAVYRHHLRKYLLWKRRRYHGRCGARMQSGSHPRSDHADAGRISDGPDRGRLRPFQGTETDADHRPCDAAGFQNADPGRSDLQCGYADGRKNSACHAGADERHDLFCDRSPTVHDPKCRPHSRCPEWRHCRTGKPRYFAETGRSVFQTVLLPVPVTHLRQ